MRSNERLLRPVSCCLVVSTLLFLGDVGVLDAQQAPQQTNAAPSGQQAADQARSDGAVDEASANYPDAPVAQSDQSASQNGTPSPAQSSNQSAGAQQPPADQNKEVRPLGTATAPSAQPSGVTGSRPAGAVIAPGKQHRSHAILISVALVAGAAIAVGSVAALSHGSPSKP